MRLYLAVLYDTQVQEHMSSRCMSEYALSKSWFPSSSNPNLPFDPSPFPLKCTFSPARENTGEF